MFLSRKRIRCIHGILACFMAILMPLAGLSFGQGRIDKGSRLAQKIENSGKVVIVTPEGERTVRQPVIRAEGIAFSREGLPGVAGSTRPTLIPWDDVYTIKMRKSGTRLGGWIGFGGGVVLGCALTAYGSWLEDMSPAPAGWLIKGAMIGGVAGALGGASVGSLLKRWKVVYSAHDAGGPVAAILLAPAPRGGLLLSVGLAF